VLLAFPVGPDCVKFNRHRVYGPKRINRISRVLGGRMPHVVNPLTTELPPSREQSHFDLDYAFSQPVGYDAQMLLRFSHV